MKCLGQEKDQRTEDSIIKGIRKLFRQKRKLKEIDNAAVKNAKNFFRLKKNIKQLKIEWLEKFSNLFEHEEEDYTN